MEWCVEFHGCCHVDAETPEEAIRTIWALNPHDGRVYDDVIKVDEIRCMDD